MITLFLRGALLYILMVTLMRALGKRQLGEFQPYELAMTILLADVISGPLQSVSTPLLYGVLPVAAMFAVHGLITLACLKWDRARALISGKPTLVISRGAIDQNAMDRLGLSLSDLLEGLRGAGCLDPAEVGTAIVEANGSITAFPHSSHRPASTSELGIDPGFEGLPLSLIMDGRVQPDNLRRAGLSRRQLERMLSRRGLRAEGVFLASLDTHGQLTLHLRGSGTLRLKAMDEERAVW